MTTPRCVHAMLAKEINEMAASCLKCGERFTLVPAPECEHAGLLPPVGWVAWTTTCVKCGQAYEQRNTPERLPSNGN